MNKEIVEYFEKLGFSVDWDFTKSGSKWYEFYFDQELLCQIDMGISLEDILKDLSFAKNKTGQESGLDYVISAPEDDFQKFLNLIPV